MCPSTPEEFEQRKRVLESKDINSLYEKWKKKGSRKGDALCLKLQELTGLGDHLAFDHGNEQ